MPLPGDRTTAEPEFEAPTLVQRRVAHRRLEAAIFDLDGLLTESESRWRQAEVEASERLGLGFSAADFESTMGVRMADVARIWFERRPWSGPTPEEVAESVVDRVIELTRDAVPLPGVESALEVVKRRGLRCALCSSSDTRLIGATLAAIGLTDSFEVVHSAADDQFGKPHPEPYLVTADALGVDPSACVAFEDSVTGAVAARAAGMRVVAVPSPHERGSGRFGFCDVTLETMSGLTADLLDALDSSIPLPQSSRPRFSLTLPVDDLAAARWFYGEVLGCGQKASDGGRVDFDLYGHQISAHRSSTARLGAGGENSTNGVVGPTQQFGLLLGADSWWSLVGRIQAAALPFLTEPELRFSAEPCEHRVFRVVDPAGHTLEFKAFTDDTMVFSPESSRTVSPRTGADGDAEANS